MSDIEQARQTLDFESRVLDSFGFLVDEFGFELVSHLESWVRYEHGLLFLQIYHGRLSYEVGAQIGLQSFIPEGAEGPPMFEIQDFRAVFPDVPDAQYLPTAATRSAVKRFVSELASVTRATLGMIIGQEEAAFSTVWNLNVEANQRYWDQYAAQRLRRVAETAWHSRNLAAVIAAYESLAREAPTYELKPSESGRLDYARKHVNDQRNR